MEGNLIKINKWLYPVSWIYGTGVWLRNKLFDWGIYKERKFDIPVISVGNITVGGTGKTPHTEYLIRLLQKDYKVAVLKPRLQTQIQRLCTCQTGYVRTDDR